MRSAQPGSNSPLRHKSRGTSAEAENAIAVGGGELSEDRTASAQQPPGLKFTTFREFAQVPKTPSVLPRDRSPFFSYGGEHGGTL